MAWGCFISIIEKHGYPLDTKSEYEYCMGHTQNRLPLRALFVLLFYDVGGIVSVLLTIAELEYDKFYTGWRRFSIFAHHWDGAGGKPINVGHAPIISQRWCPGGKPLTCFIAPIIFLKCTKNKSWKQPTQPEWVAVALCAILNICART